VPGSLDFNGVLSALGAGAKRPVPVHPLDDLASAAAVARRQLRSFDPAAPEDPAPPVAPRVRRPGR
jgi:hypothetical protein